MNIVVPTQKVPYGDVMKLAQHMFDKKIATDRHEYKKRQEALTKIANTRAYTVETMGQHDMFVEKNVFNHWFKIDRHFWDDESNIKKFKADNPECVRRRPDGWRAKNFSVTDYTVTPTHTITDRRCAK